MPSKKKKYNARFPPIASYTCKRKSNSWPLIAVYNLLNISAYNVYVLWISINPGLNENKLTKRRLFSEELRKSLVMPLMSSLQAMSKIEELESVVTKARIKKIMQTDEEVGKVAAAVPVIISRALELFVETLVKNASSVTTSRNAKTLTTSHIKACVLAEENFKFLKGLVQDIPDVMFEEEPSNSCAVPVLEGQVSVQNSIHQNCARRGRPPKIKTEPDGAGPSRSTADESETWSAEDDAEEGSTESSSETTSDHRVVSSSSIPPTYSPSYVPGVHHNFHPHQVACSTTSSADEDCDL